MDVFSAVGKFPAHEAASTASEGALTAIQLCFIIRLPGARTWLSSRAHDGKAFQGKADTHKTHGNVRACQAAFCEWCPDASLRDSGALTLLRDMISIYE